MLPGGQLVADRLELCAAGADEYDARRLAGASERGILRQEPVARMNGVCPRRDRGRHDRVDAEVAVARRSWAEAHDRVGEPRRDRVAVGVGDGHHGLDAELTARAEDSDGDLASVGDEDAAQYHRFSPVGRTRMSTVPWPAN